jgi:hypothetical protein
VVVEVRQALWVEGAVLQEEALPVRRAEEVQVAQPVLGVVEAAKQDFVQVEAVEVQMEYL